MRNRKLKKALPAFGVMTLPDISSPVTYRDALGAVGYITEASAGAWK